MPLQLEALIDARVFNFAQSAQKYFRTNDLVVFLDLREIPAQLEAIPRQSMADSDKVPEPLRQKLAVPASAVKAVLGSSVQSFWFYVIYADGDAHCVAVNASMLVPGGTP